MELTRRRTMNSTKRMDKEYYHTATPHGYYRVVGNVEHDD